MSDITERLSAAMADRYRIERELGQGGMATVYLAEDLKHEREVAIKVLKPELAAVLGAERFVTEIKTTAALQHPNILPLFDSGEADGFLYYVMPYVEGETLRTKLDRETQLGVGESVQLIREVADALQYAHEHGVVHRDIKPENILLHAGRPMVADFGIALAVSAAAGGRMTETGLSLGTPHYMSPEQATAEKYITNRSDIYSLGAVLYEMLTGEPPHTGTSAQQIIMKIVTEEAAPVTKIRKAVPPNVAAAVGEALEKLPADRFESAKAFAEALANPSFTTASSAAATSAAPATSATPLLSPPVLVGVAAACVALAAAVWLLRPRAVAPLPMHVELEPPVGSAFSASRFAAVSPNARYLAFVALRPTGGRVLWIRDLQTGRMDSLPATDGAEAPFWSPDGRAIGFFTGTRLQRVNADGSAPQNLCPTMDAGGSWSANDVILFTRAGRPMTVNAGGGTCTPIGGWWTDSTLPIERPAWLPDGHHFAARSPDRVRVIVSDAAGAPPRTFIGDATDVQIVAPDLAVFSRRRPRGADILAQTFDERRLALTGTPTTLAQEVRAAHSVPSFAVARGALVYLPAGRVDVGPLLVDARGVIVDSVERQGVWTFRRAHAHPWVALGGFGLWSDDLARHTAVAIDAKEILEFPVWGPGDSLVVALKEVDPCAVVQFRLSTDSETTLVADSSGQSCFFPSDWTADGKTILLTKISERPAEIWTYSVATGALARLGSVGGAASAGVVSPDGRWLAYASDESQKLEVYVRAFHGAQGAVRVSVDGGALPRWSGDGRALYFETPDGRIKRVAVAPGATLSIGKPELLFRAPRWSMRLFADQFRGTQAATTYDVSPSGDRFFLRQRTEETPAATLVLNWRTLLRQLPKHEAGASGD